MTSRVPKERPRRKAAELQDAMAYGLCWCGEPRYSQLDRDPEGRPVKLRLVCYAGHDADDAFQPVERSQT